MDFDKMSSEEAKFVFNPRDVKLVYIYALAELVEGCKKNNIELTKVKYYQNGFHIEFKDISGDAIIHDNSYANDWGYLETYQMPWDGDDVSTHSPEELVKLLTCLKNGEDWRPFA